MSFRFLSALLPFAALLACAPADGPPDDAPTDAGLRLKYDVAVLLCRDGDGDMAEKTRRMISIAKSPLRNVPESDMEKRIKDISNDIRMGGCPKPV